MSYQVGYKLVKEKKFKQAFDVWLPLALDGDLYAQLNIAVLYKDGLGVEQDDGKAQEWIEKAEQSNNDDILEAIETFNHYRMSKEDSEFFSSFQG